MRYVLEDIEAGKLFHEIERRGIRPRQRLRVVVETLNDDVPLAVLAERGGAFDFLADEPEIYSEADIQPRNV
jgi:FixJ family two-component response regulator